MVWEAQNSIQEGLFSRVCGQLPERRKREIETGWNMTYYSIGSITAYAVRLRQAQIARIGERDLL